MKYFLSLIVLFWCCCGMVRAESEIEVKLRHLEEKVEKLEQGNSLMSFKLGKEPVFYVTASTGSLIAFVIACICALWAQNNNRSAWLWFFLGVLFAPITILVVLTINGQHHLDERASKVRS